MPLVIRNMRTRWEPIRTMSLISVKIKIIAHKTIPLYQKLAPKIKELKSLGLTYNEIAIKLKLCKKTVIKSLLF